MGVHPKERDGWLYDGETMRFEPVRGSQATVTKKVHPVTFRLLFHAVAWTRLSLEPLLDLWTTDRGEAVQAVERVFK